MAASRRRGGGRHADRGGREPARPLSLRSLPVFKTAEAYRYPLVRDGADVRDETSGEPPW